VRVPLEERPAQGVTDPRRFHVIGQAQPTTRRDARWLISPAPARAHAQVLRSEGPGQPVDRFHLLGVGDRGPPLRAPASPGQTGRDHQPSHPFVAHMPTLLGQLGMNPGRPALGASGVPVPFCRSTIAERYRARSVLATTNSCPKCENTP
jgi:hypothetical protein